MWKVLLVLSLVVNVARADVIEPALTFEDPTPEEHAPSGTPKGGARIAAEVGAGLVASVGLGVGGALIGNEVAVRTGVQCSRDGICPAGLLAGGAAGALVGATTTVYFIGASGKRPGSLAATMGGAVLGAGLAVGTVFVNPGVGVAAMVILPTTGAVVGFNLTRRDNNRRITALPTTNGVIVAGTF
jgi:hypothetical protein